MGLDMYLTAKISLSGCEFCKEEEKEKFAKIKELFDDVEVKNNSTITVNLPIGYWRKANAIHKWFVDNVQRGEDDCGEYYLNIDNLKELLNICKKVLENNSLAESLLPTSAGFFFGSTDYNEWYLRDIQDTIEILEKCLKLPSEYSIYYQSSW